MELYEIEETSEFSTKPLGESGELNTQIDIDDTMIAKDNDRELQNSGSNTPFVENVSQDPVLRRSIPENSPPHCFEIEVESFTCVLFEDDEPAFYHEAFSSSNVKE